MNKNKKIFKFQRKQILVSNPLNPQSQPLAPTTIAKQSRPPQLPTCQQQLNPSIKSLQANDKLQFPRQLKLQNVVSRLKSKLGALMDGQPIIKVDSLFQNQVLCSITGTVAKRNRESFGNTNRKDKQQHKDRDDHSYDENLKKMKPQFEDPWQPKQPNYLDLISQGIPLNSKPTLNDAFAGQKNSTLGSNSSKEWIVRDEIRNKYKRDEKQYIFNSQIPYEQKMQARNFKKKRRIADKNDTCFVFQD